MSSLINRRDLDFLLFEYLDAGALTAFDRYAEHDRATFEAVIDAAEQLAVDQFQSHAAKLDANEPHFDGEHVHIIPEVKAAVDAYIDGGFLGMAFDTKDGGLQLPYTIAQACASLFSAANIGTAGYAFLTGAAANMLRIVGSEEQKKRYMRPMIEGRFFGTMCLSEPQAGSSLGDIKTRAIPQADGTYHLKGTKMWISGGEHDLSENIVHMVLAKIEAPDTPPGTKGISLFVVPKYMVGDDGRLGARNGVRLAGLTHKMGYRGTTSTILSFGDEGDCHAELIGEANRGLVQMFHMMNEARIGVGLGAVMLGYAGYLHSLAYARERRQGRPPTAKDPNTPPVTLTEHADIRRMLLAQKAYVEGGLALCLYAARLVDEQRTGTAKAAEEAGLLLDLLTPVVKSWPSQWCLEANHLAIQIHGGYGYTRDYPVEQCYRDNRLNPIHEGTHGIQALDLLGRKLWMRGGAPLALLQRCIALTLAEARARDDAQLTEHADALEAALGDVAQTLAVLGPALRDDAELALANATVFLEAFGHVVMAWVWLRQAVAAQGADRSGADEAFYGGKLAAARWFFRWELPKTAPQFALLRSLDTSCLHMRDDWF